MSKTADVLVEAAERLELLGFGKEHLVVKNALVGEKPMCSVVEMASLPSVIPVNDEQLERIKELEETYKMKIYHVIRTDYGKFGIMDSYLYMALPLSDYECARDRSDIELKSLFAYINNLTYPKLSGFSFIGVGFKHGSLSRTS